MCAFYSLHGGRRSAMGPPFRGFFSGSGNVTWCLKSSGFCGIQFDQDFGGRFNNIFEPAGFARLCCNH